MDVLIKFRHGLGDAVQLTAVLSHLSHCHPDWQIDVAALAGKQSAFFGQCRKATVLGRAGVLQPRYDLVFDLDWLECPTCYARWPSTKAERCLLDVFGLEPIAEKCRYQIRRGQNAVELARTYLENVCRVAAAPDGRYPVVLIHYEGNTSAEQKNLPAEMVRALCEDVIESGLVPIILDWDGRSPLPDGKRIHCPHVDLELWGGTGTGDAEVLAALTEMAALMVGVDSGPLHVAGATGTLTIAVWTGHHPLHYFTHADNVTHLVPSSHCELLRGDRELGSRYFSAHYRYRTYDDLESELRAAVRESLEAADGGLVFTHGFWVHANNARQDLVIVKDVAEEDAYRVNELFTPRSVVIDVGAHIGTFSQTIHRRNPLARIIAVECCPENIPALVKNVAAFATVIQAAVTYQSDVAMLNAVYPGCLSTGGGRICDRKELQQRIASKELRDQPGPGHDSEYWADLRPLRTITLEDILQEHGLDRIDVLKLDCEGSELSILRDTTLLDRIGVIVGEYHDESAFLRLVEERFSGWRLQVLKAGEPGLFWLESPRWSSDSSSPQPKVAPQRKARQSTDPSHWIFLNTPMHTGTHFVRFLLELHPAVSFWKCGRTEVGGKSLNQWHFACRQGEISFNELLRLGVGCQEDLPGWTRREAARLEISLPPKNVKRHLVQAHINRVQFWYPALQTVVTIRDPLLSVISALRRGANCENVEAILASFEFLATVDPSACFWFCTDLWSADRDRALGLLDYLNLQRTPEIEQFVARWPRMNETSGSLQEKNFDPALVEARRLAVAGKGIHPVVEPWVEPIRGTGVQPLLERLGYRRLLWFE